jgi:hypothetical protein
VDERLEIGLDPEPVAGRPTTVTVAGAPRFPRVAVYASGRLGVSEAPSCAPELLGLRRPLLLAYVVSDAAGMVSFDLAIPRSLEGRGMRLQAVVEGVCDVSDIFSWSL